MVLLWRYFLSISKIPARRTLNSDAVFEKLGLKPQSDILFEVQLKNYEKVQEAWEMNDEEKINQATICKEKGTKRFKEQQFKIACNHYARVVELLTNQETSVSCSNLYFASIKASQMLK